MMLHVVIFNIRDDGIIRRIARNSTVRFIGLNHHQRRIFGYTFDPRNLSANAIAATEYLGNDGGGSGFPVRTADSNARASAH